MKNSKSEIRESSSTKSKSRYFAPALRQTIVAEIDAGLSKAEAARKYGTSLNSVFRWVAKYSPNYQARVVTIVEELSTTNLVKDLERQLHDAHAALGRKDCKLTFYEQLFEAAQKELGYDLKKNLETRLSSK